MQFKQYEDSLIKTASSLLAIDSPSGYTDKASEFVLQAAKELGYPAYRNNLGNVIVPVEGENNEESVALSAHIDTLGLMVRSITDNGHLMLTAVGSPILPTLDGEYCRIHTMEGKVYTGTILSCRLPYMSSRMRRHARETMRIWRYVSTKSYIVKKT